jgi:hypothetical protein
VVAPHQAFQEISRRARPELIATTLVILLLQPIVQANPAVSYVHNVLFLSVFFLFYALGRTCLLLMACRWFSCRLSLRTAFQAVLINEVIGVFLMGALVAIPSLQGISGQVPYMKLGLGSWLVSLGETHPILFNSWRRCMSLPYGVLVCGGLGLRH